MEHEPITGAWGGSPQQGPGAAAEPLVRSQGRSPQSPEAESFLTSRGKRQISSFMPTRFCKISKPEVALSQICIHSSRCLTCSTTVDKYPTFLWLQWDSFVTSTIVIGAALSYHLLTRWQNTSNQPLHDQFTKMVKIRKPHANPESYNIHKTIITRSSFSIANCNYNDVISTPDHMVQCSQTYLHLYLGRERECT